MSDVIKQKSYEHIVHVLRRHPLTFVPKMILFAILLAVPAIVYVILSTLLGDVILSSQIYPAVVLVGSVYYLSTYLFFYVYFLDYYLDIWIVTNDRIVDIEQFGLFSRTTSEVDLYRIQDVSGDVHGMFATLFNYGDVSVKTASQNANIIFKNVANPTKIREDLIRLADVDRKYHYGQVDQEDFES